MLGDFNARTSNLNDYNLNDDDFSGSFTPFAFDTLGDSIKNLDRLGIQLNRISKDSKTNNNGYKLINVCKDFDLHILNGRIGDDKKVGDFTCVSNNGNSVVDYIIMSSNLLPMASNFTVDIFDKCLSDKHRTIYTVLKPANNVCSDAHNNLVVSESSAGADIDNSVVNTVKTSWINSKTDDYTSNFDHTQIESVKAKLVYNLVAGCSTINQAELDSVCKDVNDLFIDSAVKSGISKLSAKKCNSYVPSKTRSSHGNSNDKPWFDMECSNKRRDYLKIKNRLSKHKSDNLSVTVKQSC